MSGWSLRVEREFPSHTRNAEKRTQIEKRNEQSKSVKGQNKINQSIDVKQCNNAMQWKRSQRGRQEVVVPRLCCRVDGGTRYM